MRERTRCDVPGCPRRATWLAWWSTDEEAMALCFEHLLDHQRAAWPVVARQRLHACPMVANRRTGRGTRRRRHP